MKPTLIKKSTPMLMTLYPQQSAQPGFVAEHDPGVIILLSPTSWGHSRLSFARFKLSYFFVAVDLQKLLYIRNFDLYHI